MGTKECKRNAVSDCAEQKNPELFQNEIQAETLKIQKVIHAICLKLNITYALFYGTLIGAVRHKGFIPWDDDLDIVMKRKDYEILAEYFITHEKELYPYKWFSFRTVRNYPYMIARVCNTEFRMETENEDDCGMGTFVDIYPLDGAGDGRRNFLYKKAWFYASMYFSKSRIHYVRPKGFVKHIIKKTAYIFSKIYSFETIRKKLTAIASKYSYEQSCFVGSMMWLPNGQKNIFPKKDLEKVILVAFEDTEFYIPESYDSILRQYYGNYMEFPPEKEREGHHYYKIYRRNHA